MSAKSVVRFVIVSALAVAVSGGASPSNAAIAPVDAFCGYPLSTSTCPDLSVIVDQCPVYCGADSYLGACVDDLSSQYEPYAVCYQIEN